MGLTYTTIQIENPYLRHTIEIEALVDSGSVFMTVPEHIALQLGFNLEGVAKREIVLADGRHQSVPMIGPMRVHFANRYCDLSALVLGDEALFGAVPMEMMDLVLHPATKTLAVNPKNPYIPLAIVK